VGEATGENVQGAKSSLRIPEVGGEGPIPKPLIPGTSPGCRGRVRPGGAPATSALGLWEGWGQGGALPPGSGGRSDTPSTVVGGGDPGGAWATVHLLAPHPRGRRGRQSPGSAGVRPKGMNASVTPAKSGGCLGDEAGRSTGTDEAGGWGRGIRAGDSNGQNFGNRINTV